LPDPIGPGTGSKTLVAQELGGVRVEFETRVLPGGVVRYTVRNLGERRVGLVWNVPKSPAFPGGGGAFTRDGIELGPGDTFERDVGITQAGDDARIAQWQTQASISIEGAPAVLVAFPAAGPSTGRFDLSPIEFWQQAAPPR
jgi:hypothetical protein